MATVGINQENALEMKNFIRVYSKDKHLTLGDVKQMSPGVTIDVVIWDRNYEEYWIWDNAEDKKEYDPEEFFEQNRHQITYLGNMKWDIKFPFGETIAHPIHLDTSSLQTNWRWVAVEEDGFIHITTEVVNEGEEIPSHWEPKHMHWSEFPDTTIVGWRGPIMLWDNLKNMPQVYYDPSALSD